MELTAWIDSWAWAAAAACSAAEIFRHVAFPAVKRVVNKAVGGARKRRQRGSNRRRLADDGPVAAVAIESVMALVAFGAVYAWAPSLVPPELTMSGSAWFFAWLWFRETGQNVSTADEDDVLSSNDGGGVAEGIACNYWEALLDPFDKGPIELDPEFKVPTFHKLVLVPASCDFRPPPEWKDKNVAVYRFDQGKFRIHLRQDKIPKDVFRLAKRDDPDAFYNVVFDACTILKSTLGPTKSDEFNRPLSEEYRRAEVAAFIRSIRRKLRRFGRKEGGGVKVFPFDDTQPGFCLEDAIVDFLRKSEEEDGGGLGAVSSEEEEEDR